MVLLLVLVLVIVLVTIVVRFMFSTRVDSRIADSHLAALKNEAGVDGGVAKAISLLMRDLAEQEEDVDSYRDYWGEGFILTFDETTVTVLIIDEQSKLNINLIAESDWSPRVREELKRLFKEVGFDSEMAESTGEALADRIDKDTKGDFEEEGTPNGRLSALGQILDIENIDVFTLFGRPGVDEGDPGTPGLCKLLTIVGQGLVNINTAPVEVIAALSDKIDRATADAIVAYRDGEDGTDFGSIADLQLVQGVTKEMVDDMTGRIHVASHYFNVMCFARTGGASHVAVSMIRRDPKGCRILYSVPADIRLWTAYEDEIEKISEDNEGEEGSFF